MSRFRFLIVCTLALLLVLPASAMAADVREYQLQYEPTGDTTGALMIVSALVNPQAALPVTITVPVPHGATVLWAGEILGGDPTADPARETTVEQVGDMDVYTFTVEQSYTAQVELQLPMPELTTDAVSGSVVWTNPGEPVLVNASVIAEAGASEVKTTPDVSGTVQTNASGQSLYPLTGRQVATNETYEIAVEWRRGSTTTDDGGSGSSPLLTWALGALVVAVAALVIVVARERTKARRAAEDFGGGQAEDRDDA